MNPLKKLKMERFRLLMEYHSFLCGINFYNTTPAMASRFPSPYGVSFILMETIWNVSKAAMIVSVSLWSIIHSYNKMSVKYDKKLMLKAFPSPYGVSFILISYITQNFR